MGRCSAVLGKRARAPAKAKDALPKGSGGLESKAELAALKAAAEKAEAANKERERKRIAFNAAVNEMKAKPENMQGEFEETPNFTARQAALVAELKLRFCMGDDAPDTRRSWGRVQPTEGSWAAGRRASENLCSEPQG